MKRKLLSRREATTVITFSAPGKVFEALDRRCRQLRLSRSEGMRAAIARWLEETATNRAQAPQEESQ